MNALLAPGPAFGGGTAGGLGEGTTFGGSVGSPFGGAANDLFGGSVGGQELRLPSILSGQQLSNLADNPNVAAGVADVADFFGRPDIFRQSQRALLPTSRALLSTIG